jgi:hypothetical protein
MLKRALLIVAVVGGFVLIVGLESSLIPTYGEICSKNAETGQKDCAAYDIALVALWHLGEFLNYYGVAITAAATVAIGWFTATLWRATTEQGRVTNAALQLARDEFNATHRPEIVVHAVEFAPIAYDADSQDCRIGANIFYFNKGRAPATIVAIKAGITRRRGLPASVMTVDNLAPQLFEVIHLVSGGKGSFQLVCPYALSDPQGSDVLCLGRVSYLDAAGQSRETGFCCRFDPGSESWVPVHNPAFEYAY